MTDTVKLLGFLVYKLGNLRDHSKSTKLPDRRAVKDAVSFAMVGSNYTPEGSDF